MRVLTVTTVYEGAWQRGGPARCISELCRGLSTLGVEVTVYTIAGNVELGNPSCGEQQKLLDHGSIEVHALPVDWGYKYCYSRALANACRMNMSQFDIVHINSFWSYPAIPAAREANKCGVPYVLSLHGCLIPYSLRKALVKKMAYFAAVENWNVRNAAAIHYTTELERQSSITFGIRTPSFVVPNGFDFSEFRDMPSKGEARKKYGLSGQEKVVTFLGRLHPRKALDVAIKAFVDVVRLFPDARLLLAGPDDGHERSLRSLVSELGIGDVVSFLGYIKPADRPQLFAASDVCILVSYPGENFGMAAAEAMAAGVPVLISGHTGIAHDVEADGGGLVVPVCTGSIAEALADMLSDTDKLDTMGKLANKSARSRYAIQKVAKQMLQAYTDILSGTKSAECKWMPK